MKKHQTFEEFINRFRELSGIKTNEDVFKELEHLRPPELSEEEIKKIDESSLSRIRQHIMEHDIAIITAFRKQSTDCLDKTKNTNKLFTKEENLGRNKKLQASLLKLEYGITSIDGSEIKNFGQENEKELKQDSFLVVNLKNDENFINNIIKLGKYFCQDNVLLKKKEEENAYLFGTNNYKFPGLNQKYNLGKYKPGLEAQFMSKIRGRPFYFEEYDHHNLGGKYVITQESKEILEEILK